MSTLPARVSAPSPRSAGTRLRVLACTPGRTLPAPRFRVLQYRALLAEQGIDLVDAPAVLGDDPPRPRMLRLGWGAGLVAQRTLHALRSWNYDVTLFQREMVTTLLTLEPFTRRPRVLDVDDAIWLSGGRDFGRRLARHVDRIVCGNNYLANVFAQWHRHVVVIPTALATDRFVPDARRRREGLIGWSGSTSTLQYLYEIEDALREVFRRHRHARLLVVSNTPPRFQRLPRERVEYVRWSPETEVRAIQHMAVGLMPLRDSEWERGKCSLKMLQYAACGVPSIVSPVGTNAELLDMAPVGIPATGIPEWIDALDYILTSNGRAKAFGEAGRGLVLKHFDSHFWGARLVDELRLAAAS